MVANREIDREELSNNRRQQLETLTNIEWMEEPGSYCRVCNHAAEKGRKSGTNRVTVDCSGIKVATSKLAT